jgi:hypothetical protein
VKLRPLSTTVFSLALAIAPVASAEVPLHPDDGIPPIGDIPVGKSHGYNGPSCAETYERVSLRLDSVTTDGVVGPLVVDVLGQSIDASTLSSVVLQVDNTEPNSIDLRFWEGTNTSVVADSTEVFDAH